MGALLLAESSALNVEAQAAFDTTASKLQIFSNRSEQSARRIGERLAPGLIRLAEFAFPKLQFAAEEAGKAMERLFANGELLPNLAKAAEAAFNKLFGIEKNRNQLLRDRPELVGKVVGKIDATIERLREEGGQQERINKLLKRRNELLSTASAVGGDVVKIFLDGEAINTMEGLVVRLRFRHVGDDVPMLIRRGSEEIELAVVLMERPEGT